MCGRVPILHRLFVYVATENNSSLGIAICTCSEGLFVADQHTGQNTEGGNAVSPTQKPRTSVAADESADVVSGWLAVDVGWTQTRHRVHMANNTIRPCFCSIG